MCETTFNEKDVRDTICIKCFEYMESDKSGRYLKEVIKEPVKEISQFEEFF
jgi:hypothetical protein